jgi:probable phosphoglycerate mutase
MTRMVLIRHGEAQVALEKLVAGEDHCKGLSPLGRRQAEALRDRFKGWNELGEVDALYASTVPRAIETAEIIAPALGQEVRIDRDLREYDLGDGHGLTFEEIDERYPLPEKRDPYFVRAPGSESWASFGERVEVTLGRVARDHEGQTVVVVCHGGVIEHAFQMWGLSSIDGLHMEITNTGITEFRWTEQWPWNQSLPPSWRLIRVNDAAHLLSVM